MRFEHQKRMDLLRAELRTVTTLGGELAYEGTEIEIVDIYPFEVRPIQSYVLAYNLTRLLEQRFLLLKMGIDIFNLSGIVQTDHGPIAPPVIEIIDTQFGKEAYVIDGTHRVYLAKLMDSSIRCAAIFGLDSSKTIPFESYSWDEVEIHIQKPNNVRRFIPSYDKDSARPYYRKLEMLGSGGSRQVDALR